MSLIVFDMGRRVETPVRPERWKVKATGATSATDAVHPGHIDPSRANDLYLTDKHQKEPESVAYAEDIMSVRVQTLNEDASIREAWELIKNEGFHHLPIIDQQHRVQAIISDRDLLYALTENRDIWHHKAISVARRPVYCILKSTDIRQTCNILYDYNIGALPVINDQHQLAGIITRSDILRLLSHYGPMELWA